MKKYSVLMLGSLLVLVGLPTLLSAQFNRGADRGNARACVYHDNNFTGREQCFNAGDEISDLRNAEISSIRIYGPASVTVYENTNFRGDSTDFASDITDLARRSMSGSKTWNDRVGSLRVTLDARGNNTGNFGRGRGNDRDEVGGGFGGGRPNNQEGICVYENTNYEGRSQCWSDRTSMPDLSNWNDKISSIRVFGTTRVLLYRDVQFRGDRETIDRDVPNLSRLPLRGAGSWNDQISSLQVQDERTFNNNNRRR